MKNLIQAPGGVSKKAPIRNPLEEMAAIAKTAGEQAGVKPPTDEQQMVQPTETQQPPKPSVLEKRKPSQMRAMENELRQIRMQREQAEQREEAVEQQEVQKEEHAEQQKKQSFFEKGLALLKKRGRGPEMRPPKAS